MLLATALMAAVVGAIVYVLQQRGDLDCTEPGAGRPRFGQRRRCTDVPHREPGAWGYRSHESWWQD